MSSNSNPALSLRKQDIKRIVIITILFFVFLVNKTLLAQSDYSYLIFPDTTKKISVVVENPDERNSGNPTGIIADTNDTLIKSIVAELATPFHQSVIKLSQCSRNFVHNSKGPNVLFLSKHQGGFAKKGLTIISNQNNFDYPELNYVDLVINKNGLKNGVLSIFSHELGHVMMNNILRGYWDNAKFRRSVKPHVSMGITDYFTAFFEGWGETFEYFAVNSNPIYKAAFEQTYDYDRLTGSLWHSKLDKELRLNSIYQKEYIYQRLLPEGVDLSRLSPEEFILLEHTTPLFNHIKLRNAQQMLSCEGWVASLFSEIIRNDRLKNNYVKKDFYEKFLLTQIPKGVKPEDIFTPFENIILKNFRVWDKLKGKDFNKRSILIEFINEWCKEFPKDRETINTIFISLSVGKTISEQMGSTFEKMAYYGMVGDQGKFSAFSKIYFGQFIKMRNSVFSNPDLLNKNIGPEIWIVNKNFKIRSALWSDENKNLLTVNINTAYKSEIATWLGFEKADDFIRRRDELGYFKSLEDAESYGFKF